MSKSLSIETGDRIQFDNKRTSWLVRGFASDGRYLIATARMFGKYWYTVLDQEDSTRSSLNTLGGGHECETDEDIAEIVAKLDGTSECGQYELSMRRICKTAITKHTAARAR